MIGCWLWMTINYSGSHSHHCYHTWVHAFMLFKILFSKGVIVCLILLTQIAEVWEIRSWTSYIQSRKLNPCALLPCWSYGDGSNKNIHPWNMMFELIDDGDRRVYNTQRYPPTALSDIPCAYFCNALQQQRGKNLLQPDKPIMSCRAGLSGQMTNIGIPGGDGRSKKILIEYIFLANVDFSAPIFRW